MGHRISRASVLVGLALFFIAGTAGSTMAQAAKPTPRPDVSRQIEALAQTQAALQQQLAELKQAIDKVNGEVQAIAGGIGQHREAMAAAENAAKAANSELAELSKGLYVETSGVKADVGLAREDVQNLTATIESSRFSSGLLIALVIALQVILVLLAIRSRG